MPPRYRFVSVWHHVARLGRPSASTPQVLGFDFAGVIVEVGDEAAAAGSWAVGDEVFGSESAVVVSVNSDKFLTRALTFAQWPTTGARSLSSAACRRAASPASRAT